MRGLFLAVLVSCFACAASGSADAGCRNDLTLPGSVGPKATQQRSFTLSKPDAVVSLKTVKSSDELSFKMSRPSGAAACELHGPSNNESCVVTVKSNGVHTIYVINKLNRTVKYKLSCKTP